MNNFEKWIASFSGCDGGYPENTIWLCGIEWSFEKGENKEEYYYNKLPDEINRGFRDLPEKKYSLVDGLAYPYGIKVAKLYSAILGCKVSEYKEVVLNNNYEGVFRLNIYPIAFAKDDDCYWGKYNLEKITNLKSKQEYREYCKLKRFPWFYSKLMEYKPKIVICTGVEYLDEFVSCFAGNIGNNHVVCEEVSIIDENKNIEKRNIYWIKTERGIYLFVVPFLGGRYGLNYDMLLQKVGDKIRLISDYN